MFFKYIKNMVDSHFKALMGRYKDERLRAWEQEHTNEELNGNVKNLEEDIHNYLAERDMYSSKLMKENRDQKEINNITENAINELKDRLHDIRGNNLPAIESAFPRLDDLNMILYKEYVIFFLLFILAGASIYSYKTIHQFLSKINYKTKYIYKV